MKVEILSKQESEARAKARKVLEVRDMAKSYISNNCFSLMVAAQCIGVSYTTLWNLLHDVGNFSDEILEKIKNACGGII